MGYEKLIYGRGECHFDRDGGANILSNNSDIIVSFDAKALMAVAYKEKCDLSEERGKEKLKEILQTCLQVLI